MFEILESLLTALFISQVPSVDAIVESSSVSPLKDASTTKTDKDLTDTKVNPTSPTQEESTAVAEATSSTTEDSTSSSDDESSNSDNVDSLTSSSTDEPSASKSDSTSNTIDSTDSKNLESSSSKNVDDSSLDNSLSSIDKSSNKDDPNSVDDSSSSNDELNSNNTALISNKDHFDDASSNTSPLNKDDSLKNIDKSKDDVSSKAESSSDKVKTSDTLGSSEKSSTATMESNSNDKPKLSKDESSKTNISLTNFISTDDVHGNVHNSTSEEEDDSSAHAIQLSSKIQVNLTSPSIKPGSVVTPATVTTTTDNSELEDDDSQNFVTVKSSAGLVSVTTPPPTSTTVMSVDTTTKSPSPIAEEQTDSFDVLNQLLQASIVTSNSESPKKTLEKIQEPSLDGEDQPSMMESNDFLLSLLQKATVTVPPLPSAVTPIDTGLETLKRLLDSNTIREEEQSIAIRPTLRVSVATRPTLKAFVTTSTPFKKDKTPLVENNFKPGSLVDSIVEEPQIFDTSNQTSSSSEEDDLEESKKLSNNSQPIEKSRDQFNDVTNKSPVTSTPPITRTTTSTPTKLVTTEAPFNLEDFIDKVDIETDPRDLDLRRPLFDTNVLPADIDSTGVDSSQENIFTSTDADLQANNVSVNALSSSLNESMETDDNSIDKETLLANLSNEEGDLPESINKTSSKQADLRNSTLSASEENTEVYATITDKGHKDDNSDRKKKNNNKERVKSSRNNSKESMEKGSTIKKAKNQNIEKSSELSEVKDNYVNTTKSSSEVYSQENSQFYKSNEVLNPVSIESSSEREMDIHSDSSESLNNKTSESAENTFNLTKESEENQDKSVELKVDLESNSIEVDPDITAENSKELSENEDNIPLLNNTSNESSETTKGSENSLETFEDTRKSSEKLNDSSRKDLNVSSNESESAEKGDNDFAFLNKTSDELPETEMDNSQHLEVSHSSEMLNTSSEHPDILPEHPSVSLTPFENFDSLTESGEVNFWSYLPQPKLPNRMSLESCDSLHKSLCVTEAIEKLTLGKYTVYYLLMISNCLDNKINN